MTRLNKIILTAIFLTLVAGCQAVPQQATTPTEQEPASNHILVLLQFKDNEGELVGTGHGTGAIVHWDGERVYASTNRHVVEDHVPEILADTIHQSMFCVFARNGSPHPATVEAVSSVADIAVISCTPPEDEVFVPYVLSDRRPRQGDLVYSVGSPHRSFGIMTFGYVSGECGVNLDCQPCGPLGGCFLIDRPLWPGSSGSPVINDEGEMVGNIAALALFPISRTETDPALAIFVGIEHLRPLLDGILPSEG